MTDIYDRLKNAHSENAVGACEAALHELRARDKEIERLREQADRDCKAINATYKVQRDMKAEIERLRAIVADWESKTASPALSMLRMNSEISRLKSEAWAKDAEIARLREHLTIQAEGEADDARMI